MGRINILNNVINTATNQVEGFCIVKSAAVRSNVKGSDYLDLVLGDAGGEIAAKLWDYNIEQHGVYQPDNIIKVRATVNIWKDTEQLKIDRIRPAKEGEADMSLLVPCAPLDPEFMYSEIIKRTETFTDDDLRMLTQYILREHHEQLLRYPAALKLHHAMRGGLLYHTYTMLRVADGICDIYGEIYPALSRELVSAGIILHDVAKVPELTVGELGLAAGYSTPGQLIGHINMGVAMVERAAAELMIDPGIKELVQHMLLSHHGVAEYGSPKSPMFPEAEIVSQADVLDSRMFEMYDALAAVNDGEFTERQWALDNRQLYKHGHK